MNSEHKVQYLGLYSGFLPPHQHSCGRKPFVSNVKATRRPRIAVVALAVHPDRPWLAETADVDSQKKS